METMPTAKPRQTSRANTALAALFVLVVAAGLVFSIAALASGTGGRHGAVEEPAAAAVESPNADVGDSADWFRTLLNGSASTAVEDTLESGFAVRDGALRVNAAIRRLLFLTGNEGVVMGTDGWLYTLEEFEHHPNDDVNLALRLEFIGAARSSLEDLGVDLLVAVIPSKARVLSEQLPARWAQLAAHPRYDRTLEWLAEQGVPTVDLLPVLSARDDTFLRTDTHWSPAGVEVVAAEIARVVRRSDPGEGLGEYAYRTDPSDIITVAGDLMNFVPVGSWATRLGLPPQEVRTTITTQVSAPVLGLFDLPTIPVTLVGTSFSADERWNFAGVLREALGSDVLNISSEAVGPFVPMADYLAGTALEEVRPEMVIWEIPERYLTLPDTQIPSVE